MKKTFLLAAACLMAFAGCDQNDKINVMEGGVRMTLVTDCAELITRATEPGVDDLNENLIDGIHYYFFDNSTDAYISDGTQKLGNQTGTADFFLEGMTDTKFNSIFSGRTAVKVYVVANATTPTGATTLAAIKATALTLTGHGKQTKFVMTGEGTLTKTSSNSASTGEIKLKRVASKITLHLIVPNTFKDLANVEWKPQLDKIQIDFKGIEEDGLVGATIPTSTLDYVNVSRKAESTPTDIELIPGESSTFLSLDVPVYSYPREWENGDASTPYIYVTLPWKINGSAADPSDTYYKILLPGNSLEPNYWYDITAKLGGLGSLVKEGTVTIDLLNINVSKDWKDAIPDGNNTDADIAMPRVLAVEHNTYILYNQNEIVIPFVSSHDCNISEYTPTTAEVNNGKFPNNQDSGAGTASSISVNNASRVITFTHNLKNMPATGSDYDYQECIQTYKLVHKNDALMYEYITIIQKPALCVSTEVFKTSSPDNAKNTIFIDGVSFKSASDTYRVLATSKTEGTLTRVTASVLPEEGIISSYILGDVRSKTNSMGTAPFIYPGGTVKVRISGNTEEFRNTEANSHRLTHYYKARENAGNMIAPEFIIASSLPGVSGRLMNNEQAQLRCATFQEEGYPAGRWRLPTYAEMRFIFRLQLDGKIGTVFDVTTNVNSDNLTNGKSPYACADGKFYRASGSDIIEATTRSGAGTLVTGSVRCVYDSWYWDQLPEHPQYNETAIANITDKNFEDYRRLPKAYWTTFTWGDDEVTW